jgi:hypothetical protein
VFDVKHTGAIIAQMMKRLFSEFHIEKKVFRILYDNASKLEDFEDEDVDEEEEEEEEESDCDLEPGDLEDYTEVDDIERFTEELEEQVKDHQNAFIAVVFWHSPS